MNESPNQTASASDVQPSASATAAINREYGIRLFLLGLVFAIFAVWSAYDGWVGYPEHNRRANAYQDYNQPGGRSKEWPAYARSQGWPVTRPQPAHNVWDIRTQFIMASLFAPIALFTWWSLVRNARRRFRADAEALHGFAPTPIPYDALLSLDIHDWDRKGIVRLTCSLDGRTRKIVLDDWKFRGMAAIYDCIKKQRPDLVPQTPGTAPADVANPKGCDV